MKFSNYGYVYDIGSVLTNVSNILITHSINAYESHSYRLGNNDCNELVLVNTGDYQSAQAPSEEAIKIFERNL
jgi:hypothetical protein